MEKFVAYASVALDAAIEQELEYGIYAHQIDLIQSGTRVEVSIKNYLQAGFVVSVYQEPVYKKVKPIHRIISHSPFTEPHLFKLAIWLARYYCASMQEVLRLFLPPSVRKEISFKEQLWVTKNKTKEELIAFCLAFQEKKPSQTKIIEEILTIKKGVLLSELLEKTHVSRSAVDALAKQDIIKIHKVRIDRSPLFDEEYFMTTPKILSDEQDQALKNIEKSLVQATFSTHLLYGITGSGKTEVYLQAIAKALERQKSVLVLVPEISLTAQTIARFRSRFTEKIAILHHRLSPGERHDEWHHIQTGQAKIVIGARSAIFSPLINLGLIIVDEEHESSYKQSDFSPYYHARDVAVMRGKLTNSTVILGSATPSIESYYNAIQGKYTLSKLSKRPANCMLPQVVIVDMQKEQEKYQKKHVFSDTLLQAIEKRMKKGEQAILFLNRRGYRRMLYCINCAYTIKCPRCEISLTFHFSAQLLACHLCNYQLDSIPKNCSQCVNTPLQFRGIGTEHIERNLHAVFPSIRTIRLDADTTRHKGSHQKLLRDFGAGKADILIGTQMIAKGLHFPEVTLVGILDSDAGLHIPDFRASETTFQLITQVAGRAGRGVNPGEVIMQTCLPQNTIIQHAAKQDYINFYDTEINIRAAFRYPPFVQMTKLLFTGKQAVEVEDAAQKIYAMLLQLLPTEFEIHPVNTCGYAKINEYYRFQILIRGPHTYVLQQTLQKVKKEKLFSSKIKFSIDINPLFTF